jgi:hypothetical protein
LIITLSPDAIFLAQSSFNKITLHAGNIKTDIQRPAPPVTFASQLQNAPIPVSKVNK